MNNLFISYDLYKPDRDYNDLYDAIQSLSTICKHLKLTVWYVRTNLAASDVCSRLWNTMQPQDKLIVIDANACAWNGLPESISDYLKQNWNR